MSKITEYTRVNSYEPGDVLLIDGTNGTRTLPVEKVGAVVKDGTYPTLTAGNLATEDGSTNNMPYLFRASGDGVRVGEREYDKIVGGTIVWNQLAKAKNGNERSNGILSTGYPSKNTITCSGTATSSRYMSVSSNAFVADAVANHVLLMEAFVTRGTYSGNMFLFGDSNNMFTPAAPTIKKPASIANMQLYLQIENGTEYDFEIAVNVFDLTAMFGSAIADYLYNLEITTPGAGVAIFRKLFQEPYYLYNAGELLSVSGLQSHDTVGFNQWDEEFESGYYDVADGVKKSGSSWRRCKNLIRCLPNTQYYFTVNGGSGSYGFVLFYDANENYLGHDASLDMSPYANSAPFTSPNNACYMAFYANSSRVASGCCINLSDPTRNGTYVPYEKHSYPLDSSLELRGILKLDANNNLYYDGDIYESDGKVTRRYGVVVYDGSNDELWYAETGSAYSGSNFYIRKPTNIRAYSSSEEYLLGFVNSLVPMSTTLKNGVMVVSNSYFNFTISEMLNISTVDELRTYLASNPITVVYPIATPTTETAEPYINPQIIDPYGTEEYVSTGIVPVGHETFYPDNLRKKIEGLPWNFATLIAPNEVTYKATRNYTIGSLFIVDNILYKATAAIANGGTITPNTNCIATTLAEIIAAL